MDEYKDNANSVAFSPDSTKVVAGKSNGDVEIWDFSSQKRL